MRNFVQVGEQLTGPAPADTLSGAGLIVGDVFGVATHDALLGQPLTLRLVGVINLPKATGAIGWLAKVYWDAANARVTTTASGNKLIGAAAAAAAADATRVNVRLNGVTI
jgi:predicted RecA/RadA family phage recombinase